VAAEQEIGMKLAKVRIGERFVLDDRGGVWEKVAEDKARCFFGSREMWNKEIDISADAYCYVLFEGRPKPFGKDAGQPQEGTQAAAAGARVRILDEEHDVLVREFEATISQITMLSSVEMFRFTPTGNKDKQVYNVSEFRYDLDDNTFYVMVTSEKQEDESHAGND
jgi:hypothetical protein